jgi:hypothetical protein
MKVTLKYLQKLKKKHKISAKGTKKNIAKKLIHTSLSGMNKKDLINILACLDKNDKKLAEAKINIQDYKGMWKPKPPKPILNMSRNELIKEIQSFRNSWENITARDMDRSDERLNQETITFLRNDVRWHYSDTAKQIAMTYLITKNNNWFPSFLS